MTKIKRMGVIGCSIACLLTFMSQDSRCDVIGDSYTIGATVFGGAFGAFADDGPPGFTFDGTTKVLGNSVFGAAGDQLIVTETQTLAADGVTFTVTITVTAQDAAGNLTSWAAPGTTVDDDMDGGVTAEVPLDLAVFELGLGNGGTDSLDVNIGGAFGSNYNFVTSEALLFTTDPATAFTFGDLSGSTDVGGPTGNLVGAIGLGGGLDISGPQTGVLPGGETLAGYGFTYTYTLAIPEPSSAMGLLMLGFVGLGSRRRS